MNQKLKWGTALALALATLSAPAFADNDRRDRDRHGQERRQDHRQDQRQTRRDDRQDSRQAKRDGRQDRRDSRRDDRHDHRYDRRHEQRAPVRVVQYRPAHYPAPRYVAPSRWARGGYLHHYQRPVYAVNDYYGYGLRHPPRGYRWYRDDYGDYLLVAIATGLIADLILHH